MTVAKMSVEEFEKFKDKTKFHEPQVIRTFYDEAKKEEEFLRHHAERVAFNRAQRDKAKPFVLRIMEKMKRM